jgi:hypothetical protein
MTSQVLRAQKPPETDKGNQWLVLVIVCGAQSMVVLDATIVNVALASIERGLCSYGFPGCDGARRDERIGSESPRMCVGPKTTKPCQSGRRRSAATSKAMEQSGSRPLPGKSIQ